MSGVHERQKWDFILMLVTFNGDARLGIATVRKFYFQQYATPLDS